MREELIVSRLDVAHLLTLNRPEAGNSLSASLVEALHEALDQAEAEGVRYLVIRGAGRSFCTGFDLQHHRAATDAELLQRFVRIEQLLARIWSAPYPTLALAQGRVFGAGADLFVSCGTRLAIDGASFCFPGARFGVVLGTRRLSARVGEAARRLVTSGCVVEAREAASLGLVSRVITGDQLDAALEAEIAEESRLDVVTHGLVKAAVGDDQKSLDRDLATLVRSAARPGLAERMSAYRRESRVARATGRMTSENGRKI